MTVEMVPCRSVAAGDWVQFMGAWLRVLSVEFRDEGGAVALATSSGLLIREPDSLINRHRQGVCQTCAGSGQAVRPDPYNPEGPEDPEPCGACGGTGRG